LRDLQLKLLCVDKILSIMKNINSKFVLYHTKQKKGTQTYTYYILALYYRINNKPVRDTIKNLGALSDHEIEYYTNSVACLNGDSEYFRCKLNTIVVKKSNDYLSCAVALHFWDYWQLSEIFDKDKNKDVSTAQIAQILTALRFVQICSKSYSSRLYTETTLPELMKVTTESYNSSRIFRELEYIESKREALGKHIFEYAKKMKFTNGKLLFYDLSSANISGLQCIMAKWGHCKDGYRTHIVLMLVITPEGYPVYWDILEGNTADSTTIKDLINKVKQTHGKIESVICFDRGMVSDDNLKLLDRDKIRYITALDGNQLQYFDDLINFKLIENQKKLDFDKETEKIKTALQNDAFIYLRNNLYFKELKLTQTEKATISEKTGKLGLDKRRYFLAFNPELASLTDKHRQERVGEFIEWTSQYNTQLSKALNDRKKETVEKEITKQKNKHKISDVQIDCQIMEHTVTNINNKQEAKTAKTFKINVTSVKNENYRQARKYDGLWSLIVNIPENEDIPFFEESHFESYFEIYRLKNTIEEAFRILSNFAGIEPFHVYKDQHIKAHFTICVLSYLIDVTILNKIRQSSEIVNMGMHSIFNELKKCKQNVIQLDRTKTITNITEVTPTQVKILDVLNCNYLINPKYLKLNNIITSN